MTGWSRTEPRTVRPYYALNSLESSLDEARLLLSGKEIEIKEEIVQLETSDFESLQISLLPKLDLQKIREVLGENKSSISLVVSLRDVIFKRRAIQYSWPVSGELPERISIDEEKVLLFGHKRQLAVTLALVLNSTLKKFPGWPNQKGAWIARRSFKIELTRLSSTFDFRSMTREEAEKFTGYPGALVYVDYNDGQLTEEQEDNQQVVTCYIAERVLRGMQSQAGSAKLLQSFLISEIVATVLSHAAIDIQSVKEVPEKSILARILKQLGDSDPMPLEALKKLVTDAVALRAAVHDRTQLVNNLKV